MIKNIQLEITSRRYEADTAAMLAPLVEDAKPEVLQVAVEAVMEVTDKAVHITYDEDESTGLTGTTHLMFNPNELDVFTMYRDGLGGTTMVFVPGMRHVCKYTTIFKPLEMTLMTRTLKNHLLDEGWLELDYVMELARTSHSRTFLRLDISESVWVERETESGMVMEANPPTAEELELDKMISDLIEIIESKGKKGLGGK